MMPPGLILPNVWRTGAETEIITDALVHTSNEFPADFLTVKTVSILAAEVVAAGIPPILHFWVELSPYPSAQQHLYALPGASTVYWAAIGGGGGALAPTAPMVMNGAGVNGRLHTEYMSWTSHAPWARVRVQAQAVVAGAFWSVQILATGGGVI